MALLAIGDRTVGRYLVGRLQEKGHPGEEEILRLLALIADPALIEPIAPYLEDRNENLRILAAIAVFTILERSGHAQP